MTYGTSSTFRLRAAPISHTPCFVIENWGRRKAALVCLPNVLDLYMDAVDRTVSIEASKPGGAWRCAGCWPIAVIERFNRLSIEQQQDIINFLRSL